MALTGSVESTTFAFCPRDGRPFLDNEAVCALCNAPREPTLDADVGRGQFAATVVAAAVVAESGGSTKTLPAARGASLLARATSSGVRRSEGGPGGWRKVLYGQQPFPDNHIDGSFLDELQRNVNVRAYDYWELVAESTTISQHVSSVVLFGVVFVYALTGALSGIAMLGLGAALALVGGVLWDAVVRGSDDTEADGAYSRESYAKGAALVVTTLLGLSPVLKTLTEDTSSDTVWASAFLLLLANLLFHDYGSANVGNIGRFPGSLSLNAAIFASVMLASRLQSLLDVFAFLAFAMEWFAVFPMFRQRLKWRSASAHTWLTIAMVTVTTALLSATSSLMCILYLAGVLFLTFLAPYWLIWIQRYKNEIRGPWDEARVVINSAVISADS